MLSRDFFQFQGKRKLVLFFFFLRYGAFIRLLVYTVVIFYSNNRPKTTIPDSENKECAQVLPASVAELRRGPGLCYSFIPTSGRLLTAQAPSVPTPHACRMTSLL